MGVVSIATAAIVGAANTVTSAEAKAQAVIDEEAQRLAAEVAAIKAAAYQAKLDLISAKDYIAKLEDAQVANTALYASVIGYVAILEKLSSYRADPETSTGTVVDNGTATVVFDLVSDGTTSSAYVTGDLYAETVTDTGKLYRHVGSVVVNSTPTTDGTVTIGIPISAGDLNLTLYNKVAVDIDTTEIEQIGIIHLV